MERDAELDSLLDDALNDFSTTGAAASATGGSSASSEHNVPPLPPLPFDPMGGARPGTTKKGKGSGAKQAAAAAPPDDADAAALALTEQLRSLMAHLGGGAPGGHPGGGGEAGEEDILATIAALERQTRFSTGGSEEEVAAGPSGLPPQMDEAAYQAMLSQFEQMGADPAVASLLDTMMAQLLSKDVLYEPLQQISARYPGWLARKRGVIPAEDHARYTRQSALVAELVAVFDMAGADRARVMELMQEMQACGAPPQEIMTELAPGLTFGADGSPQFPPPGAGGAAVPSELLTSCAQQ